MGTRDRATDPYSSGPSTGRMACAEAPGVLRAQGYVRWMGGTGQTTSRHCLHQCGFKPIVSHRLSASISTLGLHTSETSFCRCVAWLLVETTQSGTIDFIPHQRKGCFGEVCLEEVHVFSRDGRCNLAEILRF